MRPRLRELFDEYDLVIMQIQARINALNTTIEEIKEQIENEKSDNIPG